MRDKSSLDICYVCPKVTTISQRLSRTAQQLSVHTVASDEAVLDAIEANPPDCVVLGTGLSMARRCELVRNLRASEVGCPCLVRVSPTESGDSPLNAGATDVITGPEISEMVLANRIRNAVDQHQAHERATHHERRLDFLLEHSSDRLSVLDEDGRYKFISPAFERLLGYEESELLGSVGFEYIHPDDRDHVEAVFEQLRADPAGERTVEYRIRDADGDWRWVRSHGTNRLNDPPVDGIVVNSTEITDQRRRQQELEAERAFTESIFAALPDAFYAFDKHGNFLRWNDRFSEVTGYTDAEIADMQPVEFIAPEDRERVADAIARTFDGETVTIEARFLTKDGRQIPYEFTGAEVSDNDSETIALVGIGRDISERKRRQRRFEAVFNNTYQFTGLMEPDGTLLEANDTALEFGGIERSDVVGKKLWEIYWFQNNEHARKIARESVERASQGELYREEIEVQGDRTTEVIDFSVRPITDEDGTIRLLVPEGRTITDLKRREQHLQVLHRFLRHNLRNKMTVINGTVSLLQQELDEPEYQEHLTQIRDASTELIELSETARELLDITIGRTDDPHPIDPEPLVSRLLDTLQAEHPEASFEYESAVRSNVRADWRLEPVLEQLAENAVVHANADHPTVRIELDEADDSVVIRVSDDGPRIPDDELSVLLGDDGQSQLTHGTGFGLWLVRSVIDDYGGVVEHEYTADGNVMTIELEPAGDQQPVTEMQ